MKGQVAFEFAVVLAIILFLSTSIMMDFFNESNLTLMAGHTKNLIQNQIGVMSITDSKCIGTFLKSFNITDKNEFIAEVRGPCKPKDGEVAQQVEETLCGHSNGNNVIECGAYNYIVRVSWKRQDEKDQ